MAKEWYLTSSSNYLSGYENDEFSSNAVSSFEEILNNSPENYNVLINSTESKQVIIQYKEEDERYVLARINDIEIGDIIRHKTLDWLVIEYVDDNKMHLSTSMKRCNSTFPIQSDKTQVLLVDEFGNPILNDFGEEQYEWVDGGTENIPCIVETKGLSAETNEPINLPEGRLNVIIPFREHAEIAEGKEFSMYGSTYQIMGIDYTKNINDKGILIINGLKK